MPVVVEVAHGSNTISVSLYKKKIFKHDLMTSNLNYWIRDVQ